MKNSNLFPVEMRRRFDNIIKYDLQEIDNVDSNSLSKINYINRLNKIIRIIKKHIPPSRHIKIADFGCGQGNLSLSLAELGYKVYAIDMREEFLEYSKAKYEKGEIEWIQSNIEDCNFEKEFFDVIVLGEIVEHCAFPEEIIQKVSVFLKKSGILIITTPNGESINSNLPIFSSLSREERQILISKQFGPDGADHLFLMAQSDISIMTPRDFVVIEKGYIGTKLLNEATLPFFIFFHIHLYVLGACEHIPVINKYLSSGLYFVLKKN